MSFRKLPAMLLAASLFFPTPDKFVFGAPFETEFLGQLQVTSSGGGSGTSVPMGVNVDGNFYYAAQFPFINFFNSSEDWVGPGFVNVSQVPRDADGNPLEAPYNLAGVGPVTFYTHLLWDLESYERPAGRYLLLYDGAGQISVNSAHTIIENLPGRIEFELNVNSGLVIHLQQSTLGNHVRNIRIIRKIHEPIHATQTFNPEFLNFLEDFSVLRLMDWGRTNNSPLVSWNQRTRLNHFWQARREGVAFELMIDLANVTGKDVWLNVPHQADDNFIREMARLIQQRLNSNRKIYIEYSNEIWNGLFEQHLWNAGQGCAQGLNNIPPVTGACSQSNVSFYNSMKHQVRRSGRVFQIFEEEISNHSRLVKVLGMFVANPGAGQDMIAMINNPQINTAGVAPDALAIAPYIGGGIGDDPAVISQIQTMTVDQILDRLELEIPNVQNWVNQYHAMANQAGYDLIAYEGGQHLVSNSAQSNTTLTAKLIAANRHPRMRTIYNNYFDMWFNGSGNGLFCHFSSIGKYSKFGSWGALEHMYQDPLTAHKYQAILDRIGLLSQ